MITIIVISRKAGKNLAFLLLEAVITVLRTLVIEYCSCSYFYCRCSTRLTTWRPGTPLGVFTSNDWGCGHCCRAGYWIISDVIKIIVIARFRFTVHDMASFQLPQFYRTCSASVLRSSLNVIESKGRE